jgi:hypothetical protein
VSTELLTERLRLRPWRTDDLASLVELFAKPEVWHYPLRRAFTNDESRAFLTRMTDRQRAGTPCPFAAEEKGTDQLIGYVGLSVPLFLPEIMPPVEIGWRLDPSYWEQGFATEGARRPPSRVRDLETGRTRQHLRARERGIWQGDATHRMHFERDTTLPVDGLPLRIFRLSRQEWLSQVR